MYYSGYDVNNSSQGFFFMIVYFVVIEGGYFDMYMVYFFLMSYYLFFFKFEVLLLIDFYFGFYNVLVNNGEIIYQFFQEYYVFNVEVGLLGLYLGQLLYMYYCMFFNGGYVFVLVQLNLFYFRLNMIFRIGGIEDLCDFFVLFGGYLFYVVFSFGRRFQQCKKLLLV